MTVPARAPHVLLTVDDEGCARIDGTELFSGGVDDLIARLDAAGPGTAPLHLITPNVDQLVMLERDPLLRDAFRHAELLIPDGSPLVLLGRALGAHRLHRLTGADLLPEVAARAPGRGWRIAMTGGAPGVAEEAARRLRQQYGADVVTVPFPLISGVDDPAGREVVDGLAALRADWVFVCLGSPKQDVWVHRWRSELPPGIYVGAGAAVDFAAGIKRRAPRVMQAVGAEWLFRLAQEPRRLARRYLLRGPLFLGVAARSTLVRLRGRR
ncbi:N-acetylglucosaminyldiphosphoundecaprenol N-acetyl-beta-D-mannosaminyltransferase [Cellulomonas marina]|uniref:N-acetylglucosaminyldiphosphoundecaprenol N-acetyl-beta-D-mannosaminyltransferase n=1 Tax=Cellulomonas marina TaxID=988821 RepID=A0A1I0X3Y0_9CELL|nr:N-acetylglucosaminyldiphosphoundecaprenol N-acetyl-beta-D-mannosaminyltransferase [Cellulomonas marina]